MFNNQSNHLLNVTAEAILLALTEVNIREIMLGRGDSRWPGACITTLVVALRQPAIQEHLLVSFNILNNHLNSFK